MSDTVTVLVYASITSVATGLGAVPFFFVESFPKRAGGLVAGMTAFQVFIGG